MHEAEFSHNFLFLPRMAALQTLPVGLPAGSLNAAVFQTGHENRPHEVPLDFLKNMHVLQFSGDLLGSVSWPIAFNVLAIGGCR